eukprot:3348849-Heterocapsa_arctica.AAC.1
MEAPGWTAETVRKAARACVTLAVGRPGLALLLLMITATYGQSAARLGPAGSGQSSAWLGPAGSCQSFDRKEGSWTLRATPPDEAQGP